MKFYQLEYLIGVCKYKSISRAADELLVSRPAVSRAIKELEQEFGVDLFSRTTAGVELTEAGRLFSEKCFMIDKLLAELNSEMSAMRDMHSKETGRSLNIGLTFSARCCVMTLLGVFRKKYPDVQLHMKDIDESFLDTKSLNPDFDLEIILCKDEKHEGLGYINVEESGFVFCCNRSHPLANREQVSVTEIGDEPLVEITRLAPKTQQVRLMFAQHGIEPNISYMTQQMISVEQMIRENICSSIKPRQSIENDREIVTIPIIESDKMFIRIVWNNNVRHKKVFYDFINFAKKYYGHT